MTRKEKDAVKIIIRALENEVLRHNKNLTKKQFYAVDDSVECLKFLIDRSHKIL